MLPLILAVVVAVVGTTLYLLVFKDPGTSTASDTSSTTSSGPTSAATTSERAAPTSSEPPTSAPASTTAPPASADPALAGSWTGNGALTTCTGFSDSCPSPLPLDVTIACPAGCTATVGDFSPGSLLVTGGEHTARGVLPFDAAPTCESAPVIADWSLTFTVEGEKLVGSYSESSRGSFSCGPTSAQWSFTLTRG